MSANTIDAKLLAKMFLAGAKNLEAKKEWINELNVFPVPDGDTGTNMTMTIMSAVKEVSALEKATMPDLAKAISSGSLRGARGNSGVILSQLLRGFTKGIRNYEEADAPVLAAALVKAVETAYKAVMKPKEGTILTVARGIADKAVELSEESLPLSDFMKEILTHGEYVLSQTPEMLPVLKEAGVVDSGGQGLMTVLQGAYDAFMGKEIRLDFQPASGGSEFVKVSRETEEEIKFGYCTEFILVLNKPLNRTEELDFKAYLSSIGDSIVVVADEEIVKVHVHTNDPGLALQRALLYGSLTRMKIDNMREEHQERVIKDAEKLAQQQAAPVQKPEKEVGFIAVSIGDGFGEIFRGLDVDYLIEGGQTMNPSTEDMLNAIAQVNARNIFIYPNNKNIILAANQARELTKDKNIIVIPTKTVPQGITAIINFAPEKSVEENTEIMNEMIQTVRTGQVTYAVRDTRIEDKEIHQGDIMAIGDHGILAVGKEVAEVARETVDAMMEEGAELISIYYGEDFSEEEAEKLAQEVSEKYSDCDVEVNAGGQPIYYCIISVE
ncbi:DAK2 domain-containing protein [Wansuia hejianensis]|uniref:DAK2 domain-containing protein n=1 Tax=Wansuia hejianensis TaxID=2763667 RepID=A0A7G9GFR3_9FIRM|nr:DAK2 domain-containing protein [Wansuia hejianensis]QNM09645.1 DAK2 domain-containing protein [Wansuia hejianensis]